jgi:hypothetical protein
MKTLKLLFLSFLIISLSSCSDDDEPLLDVVSNKVTNFHAPQAGGMGQPITGEFAKFSFATGVQSSSSTEWDIGFRGTTIIVNGGAATGTADEPTRNGQGGAYVASGTMASVLDVDTTKFKQDASSALAITTGSGNGWYTYNGQSHVISPTPGKILVFKTHDGLYAKIEILSYYKDSPASPNAFTDPSRYYTFNYIYQPNKGQTSF